MLDLMISDLLEVIRSGELFVVWSMAVVPNGWYSTRTVSGRREPSRWCVMFKSPIVSKNEYECIL